MAVQYYLGAVQMGKQNILYVKQNIHYFKIKINVEHDTAFILIQRCRREQEV